MQWRNCNKLNFISLEWYPVSGFHFFIKFNLMKFTEATEKDIELIQDLAKRSWENAYKDILSKEQTEYMLNTMYSTEEIRSHLKNPDYNYFLIQKGDETLGFLGYQHHYESGCTKLHRIYLLPEAKGKGAGKAALNFLKHNVQEIGDERIILNVNKDNPAKEVYESQGFKVYDEGVFDIGNGFFMDDYLMEFYV